MRTFEEEVNLLAEICKKCGGKCCIGDDITISKHELKRLKEKYNFKQGALRTPYGKLNTIKIVKNTPCPFLGKEDSKIGCILNEKLKPLGCKLYPLTFLIEQDNLKFFLSNFCPYVQESANLNMWIKESIKNTCKELKTWTKTEKLSRTYLHKQIHKNHMYLIEIKNHNTTG